MKALKGYDSLSQLWQDTNKAGLLIPGHAHASACERDRATLASSLAAERCLSARSLLCRWTQCEPLSSRCNERSEVQLQLQDEDLIYAGVRRKAHSCIRQNMLRSTHQRARTVSQAMRSFQKRSPLSINASQTDSQAFRRVLATKASEPCTRDFKGKLGGHKAMACRSAQDLHAPVQHYGTISTAATALRNQIARCRTFRSGLLALLFRISHIDALTSARSDQATSVRNESSY